MLISAILNNQNLTEEVLRTRLCLVEPALNARTMTAICDDPEDVKDITTYMPSVPVRTGKTCNTFAIRQAVRGSEDLRKFFEMIQAHREFYRPVVKLAPVFYFYNGVSEIFSLSSKFGAISKPQQEPSDSRK